MILIVVSLKMKFKKIMIMTFLLLAILTIGAVSAAENTNDTITDNVIGNDETRDIVSIEDTTDDVVSVDDNDDVNSVEDDGDILTANPKTFSKLNETINGNDDGDVYLDGNYTFDLGSDADFKDGIVVGRTVTIHGNGYTINADNTARIFSVSNSGVVFRDIVFVNGRTTGDGGAINGDCTVVNCNFTGNSAHFGGAMSKGYAVNCTFIENYVNSDYGRAGALYNGRAVNCTFIRNYANNIACVGGAMYDGSAVNCTFVGNFVNNLGCDGGAMYDGSAVNCNFTDNYASRGGGAVLGTSVVNCSFVGNSASEGGAIRSSSAVNCTFIGNSASKGGAMSANGYSATNCVFVNNTAANGGATYQVTAVDCNFTGNNATEWGGAMYGGVVSNSNFSFNHAKKDGGAIYNCVIANCLFEYNSAVNGGAMSKGRATNCTFNYNNAGGYGGAVYDAKISINSKFSHNVAVNGNDTYNVTFFDSDAEKSFKELNYTINGNNNTDIYLDCSYIFNVISDSDFKGGVVVNRAVTIHGNGFTINGDGIARIFSVTNKNVIFHDIVFVNGRTTGDGGAINGDCTVVNCNFTGNSAHFGGAMSKGYAVNCTFIENYVNSDYGRAGALYNGRAVNCTFIRNYANNIACVGGAMYDGSAVNCTFVGNFVNNLGCDGGAMYDGSAVNCNFTDNYASRGGGAVLGTSVVNCSFVGNSASEGGAIRSSSAVNCTFIGNSASKGGAMSANGYSATNCVFVNNTAANGGATYQVTAVDCNFTGNNATECGGAMYTGIAVDCNFINNVAGIGGDSTYNTAMPKTTLSVNNFTSVYGSNETFGVNLTLWSGDVLNNINITIKIYENNSHVGTYSCLSGSSWVVDLDAGNYTAVVSVKNNAYKAEPVNASIIITKIPVDLNIAQIGSYFNSTYVLINVTDKNNLGLSNINVSVSFDNVSADLCTDNSGVVMYKLPELAGDYNVTVRVTSRNHEAEPINHIFTLNKVPVSLLVTQVGTYFNEGYVCIKVYDGNVGLADVNVSVSFDNVGADLVTNGSGVVLYKLPEIVGTYNVTVNVTSINHEASPVNQKFVLKKFQATVLVSQLGNLLNSTFVRVNVTNSSGVALEGIGVSINLGEGYGIVNLITNGSGVVEYKMPDSVGVYNVVVNINSTVYESDHVMQSIVVGKIPVVIGVTQVGEYYDSSYLLISLKDLNGVDLIGVNLKVLINKDEVNVTTNDSGEVLYKIPGIAGVYKISVSLDSDYLESDVVNATFNLKKYPAFISSSPLTAVYNINKYLVVSLKDSQGNPISGVMVYVSIFGKPLTTDKNGQVKFSTNNLAPKTYTAKITFNGNGNYIKSSNSVKVTVKKATPKITAKTKTFKRSVKVKKYTIILKTNQNKVMKNTWVTLKINKKTYKAKTNSKGKATFKIKKLTKKGTFKATVTFKATKYYNKVTKKVKIKIK